jgi:glycosyltransferase involved in cell wall biosynthesis
MDRPPFFSVVVPTRNRVEKLPYALRACRDQDFDDYEIVVFDNCSTPSAEDTVVGIDDKRIKYFRSERSLHMSNSWETALTKARGQYVIYLGDDDGLLPNALPILKRIIDSTSADVVRWSWVNYYWPRYDIRPGMANRLSFPLLDNLLYEVPSRYVLHRVSSFELEYWAMPMLYNSVVRRDLLERIRERHGKVFITTSPDIGSGLAILAHTDTFHNFQLPLSICGISEKSNGHCFASNTGNEVAQDWVNLGKEDGCDFDPRTPFPNAGIHGYVPSVLDSLFAARAQYGLSAEIPVVGRQRAVELSMADVCVRSAEEGELVVRNVANSLRDRPDLQKWFARAYGDGRDLPRHEPRQLRQGYDGRCLAVDGAAHGLADVAAVAEWVGRMLGYDRPDELRIRERPFRYAFLKRLRECAKAALGSVPEYYP